MVDGSVCFLNVVNLQSQRRRALVLIDLKPAKYTHALKFLMTTRDAYCIIECMLFKVVPGVWKDHGSARADEQVIVSVQAVQLHPVDRELLSVLD